MLTEFKHTSQAGGSISACVIYAMLLLIELAGRLQPDWQRACRVRQAVSPAALLL